MSQTATMNSSAWLFRRTLDKIAHVTAQSALTPPSLNLANALSRIRPWAVPKFEKSTPTLLMSSEHLRHYRLLESIHERFQNVEGELSPGHEISSGKWSELKKKADEHYLDEIMRWVPVSSSRIVIQVDPVNNDCGKCHAWADELAYMYAGHAENALGIVADKWEYPPDMRRKWGHGSAEVEIPSRSDEEGDPSTYSRVPEGKEFTDIVRNKSMFWSGWYLNEGGIHVKAQDGGIQHDEGVVAARVRFSHWFGADDDEDKHWFMLNQHDIHELQDPVDGKRWLIHLPTGAACERDDGLALDANAMATLFKRVRHIEDNRIFKSQQPHHSPLVSCLRPVPGSLCADQEHDEVVRIYTPSHVFDSRSGLHFSNVKEIVQGRQECHDMLKALLEHNATGSIQRVIRSLLAVVEAEEKMKCVK